MTFRTTRSPAFTNESSYPAEAVPFLTQEQAVADSEFELGDLEHGRRSSNHSSTPVTAAHGHHLPTYTRPKRASSWQLRVPGTRAWHTGKRWPTRILESCLDGAPAHRNHWGRRSRPLRLIFRLLAICLMLLGIFQLIAIVLGALEAFFPDDLDWVTTSWREESYLSDEGLDHWPTDFTRDIKPIACHSHNDYWRREPLFSAIRAGCTGVEADVWLFDEELYVGHSLSSLTPNRTLRSLYINPILDILERQNPITYYHPDLDKTPNGVFDTAPSQSLVLLIDFKTTGNALWPFVQSQIEPLRERNYLTYFNGTSVIDGPITIVATGYAPFDLLVSNPEYRDIFFDAPLADMAAIDLSSPSRQTTPLDTLPPSLSLSDPLNKTLPSAPTTTPNAPLLSPTSASHDDPNVGQGHSGHAPHSPTTYTPANSYYASVSFSKTIGFPWRSRLSHAQLATIKAQIAGAHAQGLKVRYWSIPSWPRWLRNYIWRVLVREGVDVLNVDDLGEGGLTGDWGPRKGGRRGKWWG